MKLIAVHEIEYVDQKGNKAIARPDHFFAIDDDNGTALKKIGAAREPTDAELALNALSAGKVSKPKADAPKSTRRSGRPKRTSSKKTEDSSEEDVV